MQVVCPGHCVSRLLAFASPSGTPHSIPVLQHHSRTVSSTVSIVLAHVQYRKSTCRQRMKYSRCFSFVSHCAITADVADYSIGSMEDREREDAILNACLPPEPVPASSTPTLIAFLKETEWFAQRANRAAEVFSDRCIHDLQRACSRRLLRAQQMLDLRAQAQLSSPIQLCIL